MPYELEYKKVHNTLSKRSLDNAFGYLKGQVANALIAGTGRQYQIPLSSQTQQFVIQNNDTNAMTIAISIYAVNQSFPPLYWDDNTFTWTITLASNTSIIIELPTNEDVFQNNVKYTPNYASLVSSTDNCIIYNTINNIGGMVDVDSTVIIENFEQTPQTKELLSIDWNKITNFIDHCTLSVVNQSNSITVQVQPDEQYPIPDSLKTNALNLVLVPMRYKNENNIAPLKSITNTRNTRQYSLYNNDMAINQHRPISLYLEPIPLLNNEYQLITYQFPLTYESLPFSMDYFTSTESRQGYITYGLKTQYAQYALIVCRGCGYQEGVDGGNTCICFAIGVQEPKNTAPHSGCSLKISKVFQEDKIFLPRLALARNDNENCIITLNN